jgi:hypothetical protein
LHAAQAWNDEDEDEYAHGVFAIPRREWPAGMGGAGALGRQRTSG